METDGMKIPHGNLTATWALLVYELDPPYFQGDCPRVYATVNPIAEGKIGAGAPLTRETLGALIAIISKNYHTPAFLPPNVLVYIPDVQLAWWTPSSMRHLFFAEETKIPSGEAAVPGTVFSVTSQGLCVWALKADRRPEPATELFHYPLFNITEGACCLGNIRRPNRVSLKDLPLWEDLFYHGECTNHGVPALNNITAKDLWTGLIRKKKRRFPCEHLVSAGNLTTRLNLKGDSV